MLSILYWLVSVKDTRDDILGRRLCFYNDGQALCDLGFSAQFRTQCPRTQTSDSRRWHRTAFVGRMLMELSDERRQSGELCG